ncbi:hypothetical protein HHI36_009358, partial [Cryptolaemus montrouzieri]
SPQISPFTFGDEPINAGETVSVQCTISKGDSPLNMTWLLDDKVIYPTDGITVMKMKRFSTLNIDSVQDIHSGKYTCLAVNAAGNNSFSAYLNVNVPPQIHPFDFGDETLNSGDMTMLTCMVPKGDLPLEIHWTVNEKPAEKVQGIFITKSKKRVSQLSLDDIQAHHAGKYSCIANNEAGRSVYSSYLHVNVVPQIILMDFGEEPINSGDFVSLTCSVHKGDLPIEIKWLHNNDSIGSNAGVMISFAGKKVSTLTIDNVQAKHAGTYICLAENKAGSAQSSATLHINVAPQILVMDFGEEPINSGDFASSTCSVHKGDLPIKIEWLHNNVSVKAADSIFVSMVGKKVSTLTIDNVQAKHAGIYTCLAENTAGGASHSVILHVNVLPQIHPFDFGDETVDSGDIVMLTCVVSKGDFPMKIYWLLNNQEINKNNGITIMNSNKRASQLTIESVQAHHAGEYSCVAENKAGFANYSTHLNVNVMPQIILTDFGEDSISSGELASLTCSVHKGDLPIKMEWRHNNKTIGINDGILVSMVGKKVSTLTIESVQDKHAGTFTCLAENKAGAAEYSVYLHVNGSTLD